MEWILDRKGATGWMDKDRMEHNQNEGIEI